MQSLYQQSRAFLQKHPIVYFLNIIPYIVTIPLAIATYLPPIMSELARRFPQASIPQLAKMTWAQHLHPYLIGAYVVTFLLLYVFIYVFIHLVIIVYIHRDRQHGEQSVRGAAKTILSRPTNFLFFAFLNMIVGLVRRIPVAGLITHPFVHFFIVFAGTEALFEPNASFAKHLKMAWMTLGASLKIILWFTFSTVWRTIWWLGALGGSFIAIAYPYSAKFQYPSPILQMIVWTTGGIISFYASWKLIKLNALWTVGAALQYDTEREG